MNLPDEVVISSFQWKFISRYADEVSINNEVLVRHHDQLKAEKVTKISKFGMQGNHVH